MYDPTTGELRLDDCNINMMDIFSLRSSISYVPQDGFLFSDTIEKNIVFGLEEADSAAAREAARLAAIEKEILSFPEGYNTMVGERGVTLSGGQKQRISIARALAKHTPILLLDDSLSAVDTKTEKEIFSHIQQYMKDKTAIIITHKLTSLSRFDKIIVIDEGQIIESGNHSQLMQKQTMYFEMFNRQRVHEDQ
jgi:ATP-binding cassette subfamily B protein